MLITVLLLLTLHIIRHGKSSIALILCGRATIITHCRIYVIQSELYYKRSVNDDKNIKDKQIQ